MGFLDFAESPDIARSIKAALARRGLVPSDDREWEVHGPHRDMNHQVYIGSARERDEPTDWLMVAIYPYAVFEIADGDESRWWDTRSSNLRRIPVSK